MDAIPVIISKKEFINLPLDQMFLELLKNQIKKDFKSAACAINLMGCNESSLLFAQVHESIRYVIESDSGKIMDLLYRIDVPEKKLKEYLKGNKKDSVNLITLMILQRECQKVWYRNYWNKLAH